MSCGWLKNLELLAESPCAMHSVSSRNLSPLKTGSAPRETEGTQHGPGDRTGWRESDTGGAAPHTASEQSACQGGGVTATQHALPSNRRPGQRGSARPLHLIHGGASSPLSAVRRRGDARGRLPANVADHSQPRSRPLNVPFRHRSRFGWISRQVCRCREGVFACDWPITVRD
jgi:hypothetical protein